MFKKATTLASWTVKLRYLTQLTKDNPLPTLAIVLFSVCLMSLAGYAVVDPTNNTDSSWQYSLSGLRYSSQTLGHDVFFTYGPLFERLITFVHRQDGWSNYLISNLLFLVILLAAIYAIIRFIRLYQLNQTAGSKLLVLLAAGFLFASVATIDILFYCLLLITLLAARKENRYAAKLLLLAGVYLFSFYKFNLALPALGLALLVFIDSPRLKKILIGIGQWLGSLVIFAAMYFGLTASLSLNAFLNYFHLGLVNSLAYNEFMSLAYSQNLKFVVAYSLLFIIVGLSWLMRTGLILLRHNLADSKDYIIGGLIFVIVSFFIFKHAVIRSDVHMLDFATYLFPALIFIYLSLRPVDFKRKSDQAGFKITIFGLFGLALVGYSVLFNHFAQRPFNQTVAPAGLSQYMRSRLKILEATSVHNRFSYGFFQQEVSTAASDLQARAKSVNTIKSQLDSSYPHQDIIFYGNTTIYGEVLKQDHNVLYMPGLQNYAANPPTLFDKRYIVMLRQHPAALVFVEETEPSIDERVPAYELNDFFQYLIHNYRVVLKDDSRRQYVFQRVTDRQANCSQIANLSFNDDVYVSLPVLPPTDKTSYIKLVLDSEKTSLLAKAAAFLIKQPVYKLNLAAAGGGVIQPRTTPSILTHGVAVKPLYLSLTDFVNGTTFDLQTLALNDGFPTASSYSAELDLCRY